MKVLLIIASVAVLLVGCKFTTRDVKLTVVNESASTLTNIVAAGTGFSSSVGSLAPGAQVTVAKPRPCNNEGFTLDFDADGEHYSEMTWNDPWNGFKEIIMNVSPDFSVTYVSVTIF